MQQLHKFKYKSLNMPFRRPDLERDMMRQSIKQMQWIKIQLSLPCNKLYKFEDAPSFKSLVVPNRKQSSTFASNTFDYAWVSDQLEIFLNKNEFHCTKCGPMA